MSAETELVAMTDMVVGHGVLALFVFDIDVDQLLQDCHLSLTVGTHVVGD